MRTILGETIRELRMEKEMILRELNMKSGIEGLRLSNIERGYIIPTDTELVTIASVLKTEANPLIKLAKELR
jgi:transcriptional regulator with XRE-family HTH domain